MGSKVLYEFGPFRLDPDKQILWREDQPVAINQKAFETLLVLVRHSREIVSKDQLMQAVWPDTFVEEGNLSQKIFMLRKALGETPDEHRYIVTLPGRGYRFVAEVRTLTQEGDDLVIQSHSRSELVLQETATLPGQPSSSPLTRRQFWKYTATVAMVGILALGAWLVIHSRQQLAAPKLPAVLIGDFANATGDSAFEGTLRAALRLKLGESPYLNLVPETRLRAAMKDAGLKKLDHSSLSLPGAAAVCNKLSANVVLLGAVAPETSGGYRVQLNATGCPDARSIAREEARASSRDEVVPALGRAADALRQPLGESPASIQQFHTPIAQASTNSLAALEAFSAAEEKRAQGQDYETARLYSIAVDLDPAFAVAYARLGTVYHNAQDDDSSRRFFAKAFELRDHASERERLYITAHYYAGRGETDKLLQIYELWRRLYPNDVVPANNLIETYFVLGDLQKAVETARDAVRLAPDNSVPWGNLIRALRKAGQLAEAKAVYDDVIARQLDGVIAHTERYIIAFAENDSLEMQRQMEWGRGRAQENELLNEAAIAAMGRGQMRLAQSLFTRAAEAGKKNGLPGFAGVCWREYAEFAATVGLASEARLSINRALQLQPDSPDFPGPAAFVFANTGDLRQAADFAQRAAQQSPSDFALNKIVLPTARAAAELHRNQPEAALRHLHDVEPYDLSWTTELEPIYYRGLAYLQLRRPQEARGEFQRVLDHWTTRPETAYVALAHLGLARTYAITGEKNAALDEYSRFFALWKNADPDIPALRQAKAESAALRANSIPPR